MNISLRPTDNIIPKQLRPGLQLDLRGAVARFGTQMLLTDPFCCDCCQELSSSIGLVCTLQITLQFWRCSITLWPLSK